MKRSKNTESYRYNPVLVRSGIFLYHLVIFLIRIFGNLKITRSNFMTKLSLYLGFLSLLFITSCKEKTVKDLVTEYHNTGKLNGSVLLAKNDTILCDTTLGYSNFKEKVLLKKNTPIYIASLSKPFTAIAIMLLQQKGVLNYNDKASKYIKELPKYAQQITIYQLLTHTSGLKDYEGILKQNENLTNKTVLKWLQNLSSLNFPSGTKYEYSNSGYVLLSLIIEYSSGKIFNEFIEENILIPLKMKHTFVYDETKPEILDKAVGFNKENQTDDYNQLTTGDGGIYSTPSDLYKLDKALRSSTFINKENQKLMYETPMLENKKKGEYGFGWFILNENNTKIAMHTGGLNGFRSLFWRDLDHNITLITLTNQGDSFPVYDFLNDVKKVISKQQ